MATPAVAPMTPAAALARHLEWLEYALAAARDEEGRRRDRLAKATSKNRDKRTARLAEVSAEVIELAALVEGIRSLQAKSARTSSRSSATKPAAARKTGGARKTTTSSRRSTGAASSKAASSNSASKPAAADPSASTNGTEPKSAKKPASRARRSSTRGSGSSS